ncbi:helix-turn-helix domain-containing protein [Xylanibacter ruminicola]|uniref:Helix-turn-helix domain-containing protein n=1 Tax=Xylanibacter ruminicola TaxID=839 RepID=A0A1M6Y4L1_XYLRU|nr:AraC family transcriptional regulator [Xylanibacter ruminicola]SHL13176.1 Helix-turn-helix domain-containing protein [Xylanibacter ruminicola]
MSIEHISDEMILFFIIYGITAAIPFMAALYLLLRRGNAFAPGVEPPMRLRRWAASFFAVAALGHVWWYLFFVFSGEINSASYVLVTVLDCVGLLITLAGTLLAMLQDRRRPVWPAFVALVPLLALGGLQLIYPNQYFMNIATAYILTIYVLFSVYMVFAVRRYGRWLNDNYADLENKKVWLSQVVSLVCLLLFILYSLVDTANILLYVLHLLELVLFTLLLWRVETLPQLADNTTEEEIIEQAPVELPTQPHEEPVTEVPEPPTPTTESNLSPLKNTLDLAQIEQLLAEHCVDTKLFLRHDLTLQQLAQNIGINRFYLSQYFSRQSITYNTYINNLRINYFISRYNELSKANQPIVAQELANESGYRSYSTFSLAFKQRTGQSVTAWMREISD